jgi:hypothetical protein
MNQSPRIGAEVTYLEDDRLAKDEAAVAEFMDLSGIDMAWGQTLKCFIEQPPMEQIDELLLKPIREKTLSNLEALIAKGSLVDVQPNATLRIVGYYALENHRLIPCPPEHPKARFFKAEFLETNGNPQTGFGFIESLMKFCRYRDPRE